MNLLILSTGGTISQEQDVYGISSTVGEGVNERGASEFERYIESLAKRMRIDLQVHAIQLMNKDSSNLIPSDWVTMIDTLVEFYDEYDTFLITHGTNTLGYTASALSYALGNFGKRVILTGSQISYGYPGSDAAMNLENAIRVATLREPQLKGVMAVFGSHIITGVRVKKITEFEYDAYKTFATNASLGRIGTVIRLNMDTVEATSTFLDPHARNKKGLDIKKEFDSNVAILTEFPGMKSSLFNTLVDSGIRGIILSSSGAGDPNIAKDNENFENLREGFRYLQKKGIPIVVTTQAPDGIASMDVNEPGELAVSEYGAVPAWDMSMEAMSTKLMWLLGRKFAYDEIRTLMGQSFRGEINKKAH